MSSGGSESVVLPFGLGVSGPQLCVVNKHASKAKCLSYSGHRQSNNAHTHSWTLCRDGDGIGMMRSMDSRKCLVNNNEATSFRFRFVETKNANAFYLPGIFVMFIIAFSHFCKLDFCSKSPNIIAKTQIYVTVHGQYYNSRFTNFICPYTRESLRILSHNLSLYTPLQLLWYSQRSSLFYYLANVAWETEK